MSTRRLLALIALALALLGTVFWIQDDRITAGILGRSALVIGAVWLAFPNIQNLDPWRLALVAVIVGLAATRPFVLIWLGPAFLAWRWFANLRRRRS